MKDGTRASAAAVLLALLKAGCYLLLFLGAQTLITVGFIAVFTVRDMVGGGSPDPDALLTEVLACAPHITLFSALLTLLILAVFFLIRRKNPLREAGLVKTDLSMVASAAVITPALYTVVILVMGLLPEALLEDYAQASAGLNDTGLISFLATVIGAPLVEEIVFRGLIQSRLERAMPGFVAAAVAALAFGVCHGQIVWIAYAFVLGLLFGRMRQCSRSVLPSLAAHFVFNLLGHLAVAAEGRLTDEAIFGILAALSLAGLFTARRQIPRLFGFGKPKVS